MEETDTTLLCLSASVCLCVLIPLFQDDEVLGGQAGVDGLDSCLKRGTGTTLVPYPLELVATLSSIQPGKALISKFYMFPGAKRERNLPVQKTEWKTEASGLRL